jgi:indole-3-glycerol phosphate synthase
MSNILDKIVEQKHLEIKALHEKYALSALQKATFVENAPKPAFYIRLQAAKDARKPFFITEFKRKSPSEGWINQHADLPTQIRAYTQAGASAISVLTDTQFFGGSYEDLKLAVSTVREVESRVEKEVEIVEKEVEQEVEIVERKVEMVERNFNYRPLILQKDFILDPIQIHLAKLHGADLILLIAAILSPERLDFLRKIAESIGLGVLVEVHDEEELDKIQHLDFPVLGVNNRDLKTFRTSLNRGNYLQKKANGRLLIAESGVQFYRDFQAVRGADGFLIGTGLMRQTEALEQQKNSESGTFFENFFAVKGKMLVKACGIRSEELLKEETADYLGINFSPVSKRKIDLDLLRNLGKSSDGVTLNHPDTSLPENAVALFYKNTEAEIRAILAEFPFKIVQLYAEDVTPSFVRSLKKKVILAAAIRKESDLETLEAFAAEVDFYILDGAMPGSGQLGDVMIPKDFPYPFLLAGGIKLENLSLAEKFDNCIGVDIASGIETDGKIDAIKILEIKNYFQKET